MLGIQGKQYISPKLTIPTSSCIHPSTHNQETFGNRVPQPSKSIRYTSYGNTPELAPVLGYRGYLTNSCTKEIFDVGKAQVLQICNEKIVTTTPQSLTPRVKSTKIDRRHQEQCSRHKTIETIPRYPRDPKFFLVKFEKRKVKTSTSRDLTRATKGLRSKKNPMLRYI